MRWGMGLCGMTSFCSCDGWVDGWVGGWVLALWFEVRGQISLGEGDGGVLGLGGLGICSFARYLT